MPRERRRVDVHPQGLTAEADADQTQIARLATARHAEVGSCLHRTDPESSGATLRLRRARLSRSWRWLVRSPAWPCVFSETLARTEPRLRAPRRRSEKLVGSVPQRRIRADGQEGRGCRIRFSWVEHWIANPAIGAGVLRGRPEHCNPSVFDLAPEVPDGRSTRPHVAQAVWYDHGELEAASGHRSRNAPLLAAAKDRFARMADFRDHSDAAVGNGRQPRACRSARLGWVANGGHGDGAAGQSGGPTIELQSEQRGHGHPTAAWRMGASRKARNHVPIKCRQKVCLTQPRNI